MKGAFRTEMVIREGAGYATTVREKAAADEREERNRARLEQVIRETLRQ